MNEVYEVERRIEIDMGHRVPFHKSKCSNPHGHRYVILATARAPETIDYEDGDSGAGMVVDFGDLKRAMSELDDLFDHRFAVWEDDKLLPGILEAFRPELGEGRYPYSKFEKYGCEVYGNAGVVVVPCIPTAEELARLWFGIVDARLREEDGAEGLELSEIQVYETPNNRAVYRSVESPWFTQERRDS